MSKDENPIHKVIGEAIRNRRELLNLSQENVAFTLGFSQAALSQIELGKSPNVGDYIMRLEKHLKFDVGELSSLLK